MIRNLQENIRKTSNCNLIGYSWGGVIVAHQAIASAKKGVPVDNVVLVGAPVNKSMLDRLNAMDGIGKVTVVNLKSKGDPIYAGMSDIEILDAVPKLIDQMSAATGHFYFSPNDQIGHMRRSALASDLVGMGIQ
jgi:hypothetical protein